MNEVNETPGVWAVRTEVRDGSPALVLPVETAEALQALQAQMAGPNGITVSSDEPIPEGANVRLWIAPGGLEPVRVPASVLMSMGQQTLLAVDLTEPEAEQGWADLLDELGLDPVDTARAEQVPAEKAEGPRPVFVLTEELAIPDLEEPTVEPEADPVAEDQVGWGSDASSDDDVADMSGLDPASISFGGDFDSGDAVETATAQVEAEAENTASSDGEVQRGPADEQVAAPRALKLPNTGTGSFTKRVHRTSEQKAIPIRKRREVSRARSVRRRDDGTETGEHAAAEAAGASSVPAPGASAPAGVTAAEVSAPVAAPVVARLSIEDQVPAEVAAGPAAMGSFVAMEAPDWDAETEADPPEEVADVPSVAPDEPGPGSAAGSDVAHPAQISFTERGRIGGKVETVELRPAEPPGAIPTARFVRPPHDDQRAAVLASSSATTTLWSGSLEERSVAGWLLMAGGRAELGSVPCRPQGRPSTCSWNTVSRPTCR